MLIGSLRQFPFLCPRRLRQHWGTTDDIAPGIGAANLCDEFVYKLLGVWSKEPLRVPGNY
jgi:hypothetical protein